MGGSPLDEVGQIDIRVPFAKGGSAGEVLVPAAAGTLPDMYQLLVEGLVEELDSVGVVVRKFNPGLGLDDHVHEPVDDAEGVEVNIMRVFLVSAAVLDLLVLLLEKLEEGRPVVAAVALGPEAHAVVGRLVVRELEEPGLGEVPEGVGRDAGAVCRVRRVLA